MAGTAKRRLPVKTGTAQLTGDYEGWWVEFRSNPPADRWLELMSRQIMVSDGESAAEQADGFKAMIEYIDFVTIRWNYVDEDGNDFPVGSAGRLPRDLVIASWNGIMEATRGPLESSNDSESS